MDSSPVAPDQRASKHRCAHRRPRSRRRREDDRRHRAGHASQYADRRRNNEAARRRGADPAVLGAVVARAKAGVEVRALLADPAWMEDNTATAVELATSSIPVRFLKSLDLHAKLVASDDVAFIGSENVSANSLDRNREIGISPTNEAAREGERAVRVGLGDGRQSVIGRARRDRDPSRRSITRRAPLPALLSGDLP